MKDESITTVQSQPPRIDVPIGRRILHKCQATLDLENFLSQVQVSLMVGADLSGIELRMLSHYLARYDGGRYADILLNGDIHQVNADKIGISSKQVKTVTYAFFYGAGDEKIGHSYDAQLSTAQAKKKGKEIRARMFLRLTDWVILLPLLRKLRTKGSSNLSMAEKLKLIHHIKR